VHLATHAKQDDLRPERVGGDILSDVNWVLTILASVFSGVVGALVTTYATQAKDRRGARAEVRGCLRRVEQLARHIDTSQDYHARLVSALDELEGAMLVAGLPYYLATFYSEVRLLTYATQMTEPAEVRRRPDSRHLVSSRVTHQTASLLARVVWHPWLTAPTRRLRVRRLKRVLDHGIPSRARMLLEARQNLRDWEKKLRRGLDEVEHEAEVENDSLPS
jgi:hypothetical protein